MLPKCFSHFLVPGPVPFFSIVETGSHHLKVEWLPPVEPNGILTHYMIGYQEGKVSSMLRKNGCRTTGLYIYIYIYAEHTHTHTHTHS